MRILQVFATWARLTTTHFPLRRRAGRRLRGSSAGRGWWVSRDAGSSRGDGLFWRL